MCPMRVFLVMLSAILACYLAWRNFGCSEELSILNNESVEKIDDSTKTSSDNDALKWRIYSRVSSDFWTLADMASGRYLWKGIKSL